MPAAGSSPGRHIALIREQAKGFAALASVEHRRLVLPFDPTEFAENLLFERYCEKQGGPGTEGPLYSLVRQLYYWVRPLLPSPLRLPIQRLYFSGWERIPFPQWPVDFTVDELLETTFALLLRASGRTSIPFIWFWPEGYSGAVLLTHDVETAEGLEHCKWLMDTDEAFGLRAAFQLVPEDRYSVAPGLIEEIRRRGHEVNVHDLNHDGNLFAERAEFLRRVKRINEYGRAWSTAGFRSGVLYRKPEWFDQFEFEFDMSVPNVGHLEAQRGGCCTVFPYFVGKLLEIPVTTTQDYSLFNILRTHDTSLWKQQASRILQKHGLCSFLTHPDYLFHRKSQRVYTDLLKLIASLGQSKHVWLALPSEVNAWWRARRAMTLVPQGAGWRIEGPGSERARVAFAVLNGGTLQYSFDPTPSAARLVSHS